MFDASLCYQDQTKNNVSQSSQSNVFNSFNFDTQNHFLHFLMSRIKSKEAVQKNERKTSTKKIVCFLTAAIQNHPFKNIEVIMTPTESFLHSYYKSK